VQRLPTAFLLPIVAQTENSAFPFKRQLTTTLHHCSWQRKRINGIRG
jgi:hypothetical protein